MGRRVFWPRPALRQFPADHAGVIVGWRNGDSDYVVAAVLPRVDLELAVPLLMSDQGLNHAFKRNVQGIKEQLEDLTALGTWNDHQDGELMHVKVLDRSHNLFSLTLAGEGENSHDLPVQVIFYDPPNAEWLNYYSVEPIQLNLLPTNNLTIISAEHEHDLLLLRQQRDSMRERVEQHAQEIPQTVSEINGMLNPLLDREQKMKRVLLQVNCTHEVSKVLRLSAKRTFPEAARLKDRLKRVTRARRLSVSAQKLGVAATRHASERANRWLQKLVWLLILVVTSARWLAELIIRVLDFGIWRSRSLRELSSTAMQLDIMLRRLAYYPEQYLVLSRRRKPPYSSEYNLEYIRFYNAIWLRLNDRILGASLASLIFSYRREIFDGFTFMTQVFFGTQYRDLVLWLMSWPGGLKLHDELAKFFGNIVVWVIGAWQAVVLALSPAVQASIVMVAYGGYVGGLSLQVALVSDIASLLTLHVFSFYMASAKLFRNVLAVLASLFRLFRGRKYNVLRKRIDSGDYDLGQLLIGTFIFTILLFLLPTIATFYAAFTSIRGLFVIFSAGLEMTLMFLNHFPIFILLLRVKSPGRIPGGVRLDLERVGPDGTAFLRLVSRPLPLSSIFHQYNVVAQRFSKHYFSLNVVAGTLTGRHVGIQRVRLYNLLNSMLPAVRTPTPDLYRQLCSELMG